MPPRPGVADYIMFSASKVDLYIYDNGRFNLGDMSIPKSGVISYSGSKATLTVTQIAGHDMQEQSQATQESTVPIELEMLPDGTLSYRDPKGLDSSVVKLKRTATEVKYRP